MKQPATEPRVDDLDWSAFDFIDLGCSKGGSVRHCVKRFRATRGVGLDLDPHKVAEARAHGIDAVLADVTKLRVEDQVRFVSMMDFLEHLPSFELVEEAIRTAAKAATDFLYIFHPSFEGEEYLSTLGLRQYWWHWRGHTAHIHVADYCGIFERCGLSQYMIRYVEPIESSAHPSVLPSTTPIDQQLYDEQQHGSKPLVAFVRPLWRAQEIFVALKPLPAREWAKITRPRPTG